MDQHAQHAGATTLLRSLGRVCCNFAMHHPALCCQVWSLQANALQPLSGCARHKQAARTDSIISLYRSLPSRVRSPTPANTEKPPARLRAYQHQAQVACPLDQPTLQTAASACAGERPTASSCTSIRP